MPRKPFNRVEARDRLAEEITNTERAMHERIRELNGRYVAAYLGETYDASIHDFGETYDASIHDCGVIATAIKIIAAYEMGDPNRDIFLIAEAFNNIIDWAGDYGVGPVTRYPAGRVALTSGSAVVSE